MSFDLHCLAIKNFYSLWHNLTVSHQSTLTINNSRVHQQNSQCWYSWSNEIHTQYSTVLVYVHSQYHITVAFTLHLIDCCTTTLSHRYIFYIQEKNYLNKCLIHWHRIYQHYKSALTLSESHGNLLSHTHKKHTSVTRRTLVLDCNSISPVTGGWVLVLAAVISSRNNTVLICKVFQRYRTVGTLSVQFVLHLFLKI